MPHTKFVCYLLRDSFDMKLISTESRRDFLIFHISIKKNYGCYLKGKCVNRNIMYFLLKAEQNRQYFIKSKQSFILKWSS